MRPVWGLCACKSLRLHLEREAEDYTPDKAGHKDAVLIGRLVTRLGRYLPSGPTRIGHGCGIRGAAGAAGDRGDLVPAPDR